MVSVASQLVQEVTAHAQCDSLEDAREICADGTYFPNNLRSFSSYHIVICLLQVSFIKNNSLVKVWEIIDIKQTGWANFTIP